MEAQHQKGKGCCQRFPLQSVCMHTLHPFGQGYESCLISYNETKHKASAYAGAFFVALLLLTVGLSENAPCLLQSVLEFVTIAWYDIFIKVGLMPCGDGERISRHRKRRETE